MALGKTVRQLRQEMDVAELANWFAFFDLHGYPDTRQEFYGAQLAALVLTVVSKGGKPHSPSDYMLDEILETEEDREVKAEKEFRSHLAALAESSKNGE